MMGAASPTARTAIVTGGTDAVGDPDRVEDVVDRCQQGFPDVEARKAIALEQHYRSAGTGQRRRRRRARRPAANHDDVEVQGHLEG